MELYPVLILKLNISRLFLYWVITVCTYITVYYHSVTKSCLTGFPFLHYLLEFAQTHVH